MAYCKAHQLDCNGFCNRFDSPCIKKNCRFFGVKTNADRIRAMSDEELAKLLYCSDSLGWCHNLPECANMLDTDDGVPEEKCMACLAVWLKQPAEE